MPVTTLYTLNDAAQILEVSRNLVSYLVTDRDIPYSAAGPGSGKGMGRAKFLDEAGLDLLRDAVAEYRRKAEPAAAS